LASSAERKLKQAQSQISQAKAQIAQLQAVKLRRSTGPQTQKIAVLRGDIAQAERRGRDTQILKLQLARALKQPATTGGRSSASQDRTIAALRQNISVFEGRASTAFAEVVRERTVKAQAKIKAQRIQAEKKAKADATKKKQALKLVADSQAQKQREREAAERRKQAEIEKAQAVFQSEDIQQKVKPAFESGEESFISNLEQKRLDDLEILEKTDTIGRLEEGVGAFETGPGFKQTDDPRLQAGFSRDEGTLFTVKKGEVTEKPIKNILDPSSSEGRFIEGQIQAQLGTNIESFLQTEKVLTAVKTGKPSKAAAVFEQTVTPELAEAGTRPGSTILLSAEEAGLAINRPSEGFPAISGDLIADVLSPGEFAELVNVGEQGTAFQVKGGKVTSKSIPPVDPFALAQEEREATGLIPREPVSIGNLLGFDTPPPKKKKPATGFPSSFSITSGSPKPSNDPITQLINAGLTPTKRPITSGFIPTDRPISSIGQIGKKPPRNIPLLIGGVQSTPKIISSFESNFGSFVTDIGSDFGFDIGSDFFSTLSKSITFERSISSEKIKKERKISTRSVEFTKKIALAKKTKGIDFDPTTGNFSLSGPARRGSTAKTFKQIVAAKKADEKRIAIAERNAKIRKAQRVKTAQRIRASRAKRSRASSIARAKRKAQKSRARPLGKVSGTKPRKVVKVSKPSKAKRSKDVSSLFISGLTTSPGTLRFGGGPSGSKKPPKKPGKSTPGIFGGGFGSGRRFG